MSQPIRIGQILIANGVLTEQQVFEVARAQKSQHLPFGVLAERMFDVTLSSVEDAWVEQYHRFTGTIDLSVQDFQPAARDLIKRRPAWQFQALPIRIETSGEVLIAASRDRLARAVAFAANRLTRPAFFRVAESAQLRLYLQKFYPMPEVSDDLLERARNLAHGPRPFDEDDGEPLALSA